jgi:hypothetical protein
MGLSKSGKIPTLGRQPSRRPFAQASLQLLPAYSGPRSPRVASDAPPIEQDAPTVLVRSGQADCGALDGALEALPAVTGVTVNLTEKKSTIGEVRQAARKHHALLVCDPAFYTMTLPGYRSGGPEQRALRYRPGPGEPSWTLAELRQHGVRLARAVVEEQHLAGAGALFSPTVALAGPDDPGLFALGSLVRAALAARDAWGDGLPLIAPLVLASMKGFSRESQRAALCSAVGGLRPQAWMLMLAGVSMKHAKDRVLAAARLLHGLERSTGVPVMAGYAGPMRRLWMALGFGVELGLGRLESFYLRRSKKGGGRRPPRWEVPDLLCSLPLREAGSLIEAGLLPACECDACRCGGSVADRLARAPVHNAAVVQADIAAMTGKAPCESMALLQARLHVARRMAGQLDRHGLRLDDHLLHLRFWPELCRALEAEGLAPEAPRLRPDLSAGRR